MRRERRELLQVHAEDDARQDQGRTRSLPPRGVEGARELIGRARLQEL